MSSTGISCYFSCELVIVHVDTDTMAAEDDETFTYEHSCPDVVPHPAARNVEHDRSRRQGEQVVGPREEEVVNDRYGDHEEQSEEEEPQHVRDRVEQPDQHLREDHPGATAHLPGTDHVAADAGTSTSNYSNSSAGFFSFLCSACYDVLGCGNGSGACTSFWQDKWDGFARSFFGAAVVQSCACLCTT
ncbi:unnamed protein product, partial [Amoebophrya sp. A120]